MVVARTINFTAPGADVPTHLAQVPTIARIAKENAMQKLATFLSGVTAPLACAVVSALLSTMFACASLDLSPQARSGLVTFSALLAVWCVAMVIERMLAPAVARIRARLRPIA